MKLFLITVLLLLLNVVALPQNQLSLDEAIKIALQKIVV